MSVLDIIINLSNTRDLKINSLYKGSNRINNVGDGLEEYLKEAIAGTFDLETTEKLKKFSQVFSYQGSSARPPDLMLRQGDAIEIKKTESLFSELQLNSSHPKSKLYADSPFINNTCRECEIWEERDIIYAVGHVDKNSKNLKSLWCVYGSLYAANQDVYLDVKNQVRDSFSNVGSINLNETKEIARLNKIDPLKITNLRVRGMWLIQPPAKVFNYLYEYDQKLTFQMFLLIPEDKYLSFDNQSLDKISDLVSEGLLHFESVQVKDPNNPVHLLSAILLTLRIS